MRRCCERARQEATRREWPAFVSSHHGVFLTGKDACFHRGQETCCQRDAGRNVGQFIDAIPRTARTGFCRQDAGSTLVLRQQDGHQN